MAKRKIKAEEEIKEEKDLDVKKDEKDLEVKEEVSETKETPTTEEKEDLIVLSDGATVEENVKLTEEEAADLAKITKADGTEIFVETPEGSDEEKKEVYEAIIEAETPAEEVAEDLEGEVNDEIPEAMEEIEEVGYVPAACHTAHASLNNSYYILKLKGGKLKALKAGKILNRELKASIIKAYKEGKKLPEAETVFNKIASKVGTTFGAFTRLASKLSNKIMRKSSKIMRKANRILPTVGDTVDMGNGKEVRVIAKKAGLLTLANGKKVLASKFMPDNTPKVGDTLVEGRRELKIVASKGGVLTLENGKKVLAKHLVATDLPDTIPGVRNDKADELKNFSIDEADIKKDNIDSVVALEKAELEEGKTGVKAAPSKVKSLYNRLPGKSGVSEDVEWSMKDFNKERNKADKTLASQIKALRDATKEIRNQKEVLASKDAEIKALQQKLAAFDNKEQTMIKSAKINKILASMSIEDDEEKAAMTEKFAKYTKAQLDAVYEIMTACPSEEATIMHERMINEEMRKEASALKGFVPGFKLEEEVKASASDEMEKLVLERELDSINK